MFYSFIHVFISVYEILTMGQDLHKLSNTFTAKSGKVGVIIPVLQTE